LAGTERGIPPSMGDLVTVFESTDVALIAIAKGALQDADIRFVVQNEFTQNLLGVGQLGSYNHITGPVRIRVVAEDAEVAQELLSDLAGEPDGAV
ncbi:MAG: DUF2007 domain-containing protein, partial [Gemmatimonadales bacterium]